jgi:hypothetical protein
MAGNTGPKLLAKVILLLFAEILATREFDRNFSICNPDNFPLISHSIFIRFTRFLGRLEAFIVPEMHRASSMRNDRYFDFLEKWASNSCLHLNLKNGGRD